jgi:Glycosyltransferase family 87
VTAGAVESPRSGVDLTWLGRRLGVGLVWVLAAYYASWAVPSLIRSDFVGIDSHAYWLTGHTGGSLYTLPAGSQDAFLYSPVFAAAVRPLTLLPYSVFAVVWAAIALSLFAWLLRRTPLVWSVPLFVAVCVPELMMGNIYALLATALVLAYTPGSRPAGAAAVAFLVLTKITPGLTGLWYVARWEVKRIAIAAATTVGLVAVTFAVAPQWWIDYAHFLTQGGSHPTSLFPARVALALVLAVVAARSGRAELLPVAVLLSLPVLGGPTAFSVLAAVPRLHAASADERRLARRVEAVS